LFILAGELLIIGVAGKRRPESEEGLVELGVDI
jgi:hypothetical protein